MRSQTMDDDTFTRPVSITIICFTFMFVTIFNFFGFNSFGEEHPLPQPVNEEMIKKSVPLRTTCRPVPAAVASLKHVTPQVEGKWKFNISPSLRKKSEQFHPIIVKAASRYEMDPALIKAVIMAESGYNSQAISRQGAKGLMQLMPKTAEALGVENSLDPEHNVNGGVKYLKQLLDEFNHDVKLALAAYNAGSSKVRRHQGIPPIKATRHYVKKVFAYYQYYKSETIREADSA